MNRRNKVARKTALAAIRGSVPDGKVKGARIVLSDAPQGAQPIGGFTEFGRKKGGAVVRIGAPAGDDAFGITVRGHETAHATHDKRRRKKVMTANEMNAVQVVGDVINESRDLPFLSEGMMRQYNRAHLATALRVDVRSIVKNVRNAKRGLIPDTVALRNGNLLASVRAIGMLKHYGESTNARRKGLTAIKASIGDAMYKAARSVSNVASYPSGRNRAIGMLVALMETEPSTEREGEKGNPDDEGLLETIEGDALDGHMRLENLLPKSVYCCKEKQISRRNAPSGVIINARRYVNAIVNGCADGLFARRLKQKAGGCVVIDASGSMGASKANLSAICKLVPTATVGYYSGGTKGRGVLCVYADAGKRFNGELPSEHLEGGNAVDLPAVRWLMKHPRPWVLVSDLQFCGGVSGSEEIALALVERATKRGLLTVYRSLEEAFEAFGGKGVMPS